MNYWEGFRIIKSSFNNWLDDKALMLGAALAFYSVLALGPLVIIFIAVISLAFKKDIASEYVIKSIDGLVGQDGASIISLIVNNYHSENTSIFAIIIGFATLFIGASGVFGQLQDALNYIWKVKPTNTGLISLLKRRFLSFTMVLGTGFLLLVSLIVSSVLAAMAEFFITILPGWEVFLEIINSLLGFAIITLLFAMIYKFLPDAEIKWKDIWFGAIITALLFTIGKFLIGFYIGKSAFSSTYGAAGAIIIILLWVYYSSQILFFGAELTKSYAAHHGSKIIPKVSAVAIIEKEIHVKKKS